MLRTPPNHLIWLDPGLTTGWALYNPAVGFRSGEYDFQTMGEQLELAALFYGSELHIGWEQFIITPQTARFPDSHWAMEVIGVARFIAQKYKVVILPAFPASAKSLGGLQKLKRLGWHNPGKGHANDAACHLVAYLLKNHMMSDELLGKALASG